MDRETYNGIDAVNWSALKYMKRTPAHFKQALERSKKTTPAMLKGLVTDCALTEPEELAKRYFVLPEFKWNSKTNKEAACDEFAKLFSLLNIGGIGGDFLMTLSKSEVITAIENTINMKAIEHDHFVECRGMSQAVMEEPILKNILANSEKKQMVLEWEDEITKVKCKGIPDLYSSQLKTLTDIKTTENAAWHAFQRTATNFDYFGQLAFYQRGLRAHGYVVEDCVLAAVESIRYHGVKIYPIAKTALEFADQKIDEYLKKYKWCRDNDQWPGYDQDMSTLEPLEWYYK